MYLDMYFFVKNYVVILVLLLLQAVNLIRIMGSFSGHNGPGFLYLLQGQFIFFFFFF